MSKLLSKFLDTYNLSTLRDVAFSALAGSSIVRYNSTTQKWENVKIESHYYEDEAVSTTTSATFVDKINQTTPSLTGGTYRVGFSCEVSNTKKSQTVAYMASANGQTIADGEYAPVNDNEYMTISGHKEIVLPAGPIDLLIQFSRPGANIAEIRRARIWIERVFDR